MKWGLRSYFIALTVLICTLAVVTFLVLSILIPQSAFSFIATLPVFTLFYGLTLLAGYMIFKANQKQPGAVVRASMAATVLKFFLYLGLLAIYLLMTEGIAKEIGTLFAVLYVTCTVFEKTFLFKSLKKSNLSNDSAVL